MNKESRTNSRRTIVCPACKKQIIEQAPVEIPTSKMQITPSVRVDSSDEIAGTSLGNIFCKNGKYYLVFETMCCCPFCNTFFELDIPIEFAEIEKGVRP